MGESGASYRLENRKDNVMVTSGRVHAARDELPEFPRYPIEVARPSQGSKKARKWGRLSDPESKRRKRIVKYKVYAVEGKVKASIKKGFRWFKNKVSELVHGY